MFHGGSVAPPPDTLASRPDAASDVEWVNVVADWHKSFEECSKKGFAMPKVKGAKRSSFAPVAEELKVRFIDYGYVFGLLVLFTRVYWNLTHSISRHQVEIVVRPRGSVQGAQLWQSARIHELEWRSSAPFVGSFRFHHFNIDFCRPMSQ